ncbi:hypothetical protein ASG48_15810 [Aurantimonas sp. Leaf443]|nr:hypothetical protein ASG48_15810 [Aurantimonas sp. Leaf443]
MTIERYWSLALLDEAAGYYTTAEPFGRGGDFTTAPEIHQIFGELLGAWVASAWMALGRPTPFVLAEIGPGRGTLMADMLRTLRSAAPACLKAAEIRLVEVSDRLAQVQAETLSRFDLPLRHVRRLEEIEARPTILVANELLDALPIRQFVHSGGRWIERCVVRERKTGALVFEVAGGEARIDPAKLGLPVPAKGDIVELSPSRERQTAAIGARIAAHGGACLLIDYGHARPGYGDTLQAVKDHGFADPLEAPGTADVTSHVDFHSIARELTAAGLSVSPTVTQGDFLLALGLNERAGALSRGKALGEQDSIRAAAKRLAGPGAGQMGRLFKAICGASRPLALPPFGLRPAD